MTFIKQCDQIEVEVVNSEGQLIVGRNKDPTNICKNPRDWLWMMSEVSTISSSTTATTTATTTVYY